MKIELYGVAVDSTANPNLFAALALKGAKAMITRSPITGQALRVRSEADASARAQVLFNPDGLNELLQKALREAFPEVSEAKIVSQAERLANALSTRGAAKATALAWVSVRADRHESFNLLAYWGEKPQKAENFDTDFDFEEAE